MLLQSYHKCILIADFLESGNFFIASSWSPTDQAPITLLGTDQTDADYLLSFANTTYPTMAVYNESLLLLCAEHPTDGVRI